jgi:hypothetical protein
VNETLTTTISELKMAVAAAATTAHDEVLDVEVSK